MLNVIFYNIDGDNVPKIKINQSYFPTLKNNFPIWYNQIEETQKLDVSFPAMTISSAQFLYPGCTEATISLPSAVKVTDLFSGDEILQKIDIDIPSATDISWMCADCYSLKSGVVKGNSIKKGQYAFRGSIIEVLCCSDDQYYSWGGAFGGAFKDKNILNINLSSLQNAYEMFSGCPELVAVEGNLSNLVDGNSMFSGCQKLKYVSLDLGSLTNGTYMFSGGRRDGALQYFDTKLPALYIGDSMFSDQTNLKKFSSELPNLYYANDMFYYCESLNEFNSTLPSLTYGCSMFYHCNLLTKFVCDLPYLVDGRAMFSNCNSLTTFQGNLGSLLTGHSMFSKCKLTPESIMYIIDGINDVKQFKEKIDAGDVRMIDDIEDNGAHFFAHGLHDQGSNWGNKYVLHSNRSSSISFPAGITLGINVTNDQATITDQLQTFAEEAGFDTWQELKQEFTNKGWTATFQYGGTDTDVTLSQDEEFRGVPVYARIEEVLPAGETLTDKEKDSAEYCTEDGTRYFNIDWGHDVNDYDKFQHFGSLLEACGYFGVIPKKYLQEVTES